MFPAEETDYESDDSNLSLDSDGFMDLDFTSTCFNDVTTEENDSDLTWKIREIRKITFRINVLSVFKNTHVRIFV